MKTKIKKSIRYTGIIFAALALILTLVVFALGIMVATQRGQAVLIGIVNDQIPGQINLRSLNFSLTDQEAKLQGLEIKDPGGKTVVAVEEILLGLDLLKLLSDKTIHFKKILILSPDLGLVQDEEDLLNITACFVDTGKESEPTEKPEPETSTGALPVNFVVESLLVEGASLSFDSRDLSFNTDGIALEGSGNLAQMVVNLSLKTQDWSVFLPPVEPSTNESLEVESSGKSFKVDSINLDLNFDKDSLKTIDFSLRSVLANLGIKGSATDLFNNPGTDIKLDFMADLEGISSILPGDIAMEGIIKGEAGLTGTVKDPRLKVLISSEGGKVLGESFERTAFDLKLENQVVTLKEATTTLDYGSITAGAEIDLTDAFPQGFMGTPLIEKIRATLDLTATDAGYGNFPRGDGRILIGFSDETLAIKRLDINLLDSNFSLAGTINPMEDRKLASPGKINTNLEFSSTRIILENFLGLIPEKETSPKESKNQDVEDEKEVKPTLKQTPIGGEFAFNGSIKGNLDNPTLFLKLSGEKISLPGDGDKNLENNQIDVQLHLKDHSLTLKRAAAKIKGGTIEADGIIDLAQAFPNGFLDEMNIEKVSGTLGVRADDFRPQPILEVYNIPGVHGKLTLDLTVKGALAKNPRAALSLIAADAGYQDSPRADANFSLEFLDGFLEINEAKVANPHGALTLGGKIKVMEKSQPLDPGKMSGNLRLKVVDLNPSPILANYKELPEIHGRYSLDLNLEGSMDKPQAALQLTAKDGGYANFPKADANFDLLFIDDHLEVNKAHVTNPNTDIDLQGRIKLMQKGKVLPPEKIEVKADLKVEQTDLAALIDIAKKEVGNGSQTKKTTEKQALRAALTAEGTLEQKISVMLNGKVPAAVAQLFTPEIAKVKGEVNLQMTALVEQEIEKSSITGKVTLDEISMFIPQTGQKLHSINGVILADREGITVSQMGGNLDRGSFNLTGKVQLANFSPDSFRFDFKARNLPLELPDSMIANFQTDLFLDGTFDQAKLKGATIGGEIILLSGEWTADFNLEQTVLEKILGSQRSQSSSPGGSSDSVTKAIALDVSVLAKSPFVISNNLADLFVNPDLKIGGTVANPSVTGRANLGPGSIAYQGRQFELETASVDFVDPYGIKPVLDIRAENKVRDWQVILKLTGPPDNLLLELSSIPKEEHADVLSLLLTGKTTNELISSEGGTTTSPAALVAGLAASSFGDRLKESVGLDVFELGFQDSDSGSAIGDVNLTVGKEITDKITVSYGMETKEGEMVQKTATDYKLSDDFSLSGFQNTQGHYGAEVRYRLEFR